jgi:hypothetical protein
MKKLSPGSQRWLKSFHAFFASMWVGAAIVLSVKQFFVSPINGGELYGIHATMDFIDNFIIIPGAVGVLLTGIVYSVWTNWGLFKHRWVTVKWVACVYGIVSGTYPLGPWQSSLMDISKEQGLKALVDPTYLHNKHMLCILGTFQVFTLIFAIFVSALKPWEKKAKARSGKDGSVKA